MKPVHDVVGYAVPSHQILKDAQALPSLCAKLPPDKLERAARGLLLALMNCEDLTEQVRQAVSTALRLASLRNPTQFC